MDRWAVLLMLVVGTAYGLAAIGLARGARWGQTFALAVLALNLAGDLIGAGVRRDPRILIGVPIGGAMIAYLLRRRKGRIADRCANRLATKTNGS